MRWISLVILLSYSLMPHAQLAADFTVTDANGNEVSLYADLLDQGKTVVLELFYLEAIACGCSDTSPLFEQFYQYWGAGQDMVEMMMISHEDSNEDLASYSLCTALTFPMVGNDGGGVAVFEEYSSGTYGVFHGFPTFVIIAPDGTVAFNPTEDNVEVLTSVNNILEEIMESGTVDIESQNHDLGFELIMPGNNQIQCKSEISGHLQLMTLGGKLLLSTQINRGLTIINTDVPKGIYVVMINSAEGTSSQTIFIR
jgi:peroxiredoxin